MRKFVADTLAMIIFSTVVGMIIEIGIAGLTIKQSFNARMIAILVNLLTGRLQGIFYDWIFKKLKVRKEKILQKYIGEVIAFGFFQIPFVNASILFLVGANFSQISRSGMTLIIISIFISKPYGFLLNFCRKLFKTSKKPI